MVSHHAIYIFRNAVITLKFAMHRERCKQHKNVLVQDWYSPTDLSSENDDCVYQTVKKLTRGKKGIKFFPDNKFSNMLAH